jgi:single-stranded DNA-binding protein
MIDALVGGTLAKDPETRTARNGNPYALATLRVPTGPDTVIFARVMAFDAHVRDELLALAKGDPVHVAGPLEVSTWKTADGEVRPSASMIAHALISPYHVRRKRAEVSNAQATPRPVAATRGNGTTGAHQKKPQSTPRRGEPMPDDPLDF